MIIRRMHLSGNFGLLGGPLKNFITFTLVEVPEDIKDYRKKWNLLLTKLRQKAPGWAGVRIHELFPGRWGWCSHGVHTHVVCNDAIGEKEMRRIAVSSGFGRMSFKEILAGSEEQAAKYLSKYLGKKRAECLKGWQLVRSFGIVDPVRLVDIEKVSALTEAWAYAKAKIPWWPSLGWQERNNAAARICGKMWEGMIPCESLTDLAGKPLVPCPF